MVGIISSAKDESYDEVAAPGRLAGFGRRLLLFICPVYRSFWFGTLAHLVFYGGPFDITGSALSSGR